VTTILLRRDSPLLDEALTVARRRRARVLTLDGSERAPVDGLDPGEPVLIGSSVPSFYIQDLLQRCQRGDLASVRVLADGDLPEPARIGFRWRPWLRAIHLLEGSPGTWRGAVPAPVVRSSSIEEILEGWGPPPVRTSEHPNGFPPRVQIQTTTGCRVGCAYCPRPSLQVEERQMDDALFDGIVGQCGAGGAESLELYLHAEPLADPRLEQLAGRAAAACPGALISIVTHERSIDRRRAARLAGSALDVVFVSVNVTGDVGSDVVRSRLRRVAGFADVLRGEGKELVVVTLANLLRRPGPFRRACAELDLPLESFRATTRAGNVDIHRWRQLRSFTRPPLCDRPFTTAHVGFDGAVIACCEDWRRERVLGRVGDRSLAEIWRDAPIRRLRRELLERRPGPLCGRCELAGAVD